MKKRILGFIGFVIVVVLVGLVFQYTPQSSQTETVQIVPSANVSLKAVPESKFFGVDGNDMVAVGLMPMVATVRCFKRYTERPIHFSAHDYSVSPSYFKASSQILYWYCHNLKGRDWVRPYQMSTTILYTRNECSPADRPLRGFLVTNHFRDHYRHISYNKRMWMHCHNRGFSSRVVWLPRRSTGRLFNRSKLPPDAINYIKANYVNDLDGHSKKRLPMFMHSSDGGRPGGVPV